MRNRRSERGVALFIVLFALMLLSALGMGLLFMSDVETSINSNYRDSQRAYFAASAGLQEVRERLRPNSPSAILPADLPTALPTLASAQVIYITNPAAGDVVAPWNAGSPFFDDQLCHEGFPALVLGDTGTNVPCVDVPGGNAWFIQRPSTAPFTGLEAALPYKWVRITLKSNTSAAPFYVADPATTSNTIPICWNGRFQTPKPITRANCDSTPPGNEDWMTPVYRLTALAQTTPAAGGDRAGSRRMVQMEVAQTPPLVTNAAVDSQDHVTLNGRLFVNGYDNCSCACSSATDHGVTVWSCLDRPGKTCNRDKWAIYSAQTVENPGASETIIAGQTPPIAERAPWIYNIPEMVESLKTASDAVDMSKPPYNWACLGDPKDCGTQTSIQAGVPPTFPPTPPDNPAGPANMRSQVTYVPGNLHLTGGSSGNGILVVDGDLDINGGLEFYGLILVKGVVRFSGGGANPTNIYGAVLAGQQSIDDTVLGGSASIYFDMCALLNNRQPQPPRLLSAHELTY